MLSKEIKRRKRKPVEERFFSKVQKTPECWLWTGAKDREGYGRFDTEETCLAHRFSYLRFVGPIPEGYCIDHICRNTTCVNPQHLRPLTAAENTMISRGVAPRYARRDKCAHGHPLMGQNVRLGGKNGNSRRCLTCRAAFNKQRSRNITFEQALELVGNRYLEEVSGL